MHQHSYLHFPSKTFKLSISRKQKSKFIPKVESSQARNGDQNPTPNKFDRRDVLIGLGSGLYGATSLSRDDQFALSAPVSVGDCGNVNISAGVDINCCPPVSTNIIDFKPPSSSNSRLRVRPVHI